MSWDELNKAIKRLSTKERAQLRDVIDALEEGVSVEELHAIDRALDEALESKGPRYSIAEARIRLHSGLAGQKESVSIDETRSLNRALDMALNGQSPTISADQFWAEFEQKYPLNNPRLPPRAARRTVAGPATATIA